MRKSDTDVIPFAPRQAKRFVAEVTKVRLIQRRHHLEIEFCVSRAPPKRYDYFVNLLLEDDDVLTFRLAWQTRRATRGRAKLFPFGRESLSRSSFSDVNIPSAVTGCLLHVKDKRTEKTIVRRMFRTASGLQGVRIKHK